MNISMFSSVLCVQCPLVGLPGPWTWNTSVRFDSTIVSPGIKDAILGSLDGYA